MEYFSFGRYKGRRVQDIIKEDPEYVAWCNLNVPFFGLTSQQKNMLGNEIEKQYLSKGRK